MECFIGMFVWNSTHFPFYFPSQYGASQLNMEESFNPFALRTAKTLWSFGCSERSRVKEKIDIWYAQYFKHLHRKNGKYLSL